MNVLFWERCNFPISFSGRDTKGTFEIVSEEVLWSLRRSYQSIWGPLSRMLHDILSLDDDYLQWHPPLIRHYTNFWPYYWSGPYYQIWLFTELWGVSIDHLQRVRHANRGRLLLWTPGSVQFWDLQVFLWPISPELVLFPDFEFRSSFGTSVLLQTENIGCPHVIKNSLFDGSCSLIYCIFYHFKSLNQIFCGFTHSCNKSFGSNVNERVCKLIHKSSRDLWV